MAVAFNIGVYYFMGHQKALEFLTGYLIEESLSVDNLFVFIMIFGFFRIEPRYQHKILFWGIIGAIFMRALFIFAGVALIHQFDWVMYIFGGFKMCFNEFCTQMGYGLEISNLASLGVIVSLLTVSIIASLMLNKKGIDEASQ